MALQVFITTTTEISHKLLVFRLRRAITDNTNITICDTRLYKQYNINQDRKVNPFHVFTSIIPTIRNRSQ